MTAAKLAAYQGHQYVQSSDRNLHAHVQGDILLPCASQQLLMHQISWWNLEAFKAGSVSGVCTRVLVTCLLGYASLRTCTCLAAVGCLAETQPMRLRYESAVPCVAAATSINTAITYITANSINKIATVAK